VLMWNYIVTENQFIINHSLQGVNITL